MIFEVAQQAYTPTLVALTLSSFSYESDRALYVNFFLHIAYNYRDLVLGAERRPAPRHMFRGECCAPAVLHRL